MQLTELRGAALVDRQYFVHTPGPDHGNGHGGCVETKVRPDELSAALRSGRWINTHEPAHNTDIICEGQCQTRPVRLVERDALQQELPRHQMRFAGRRWWYRA